MNLFVIRTLVHNLCGLALHRKSVKVNNNNKDDKNNNILII